MWDTGFKTVHLRDVLSKDLMLANVENRVPGMPVDRKCLLLRIIYSKDGAAKIEVVKDLYPSYH